MGIMLFLFTTGGSSFRESARTSASKPRLSTSELICADAARAGRFILVKLAEAGGDGCGVILRLRLCPFLKMSKADEPDAAKSSSDLFPTGLAPEIVATESGGVRCFVHDVQPARSICLSLSDRSARAWL